jgi:hypothetical protein
MLDFTVKAYHKLLDTLVSEGYSFQTFEQFLALTAKRVVILRHDVDARNQNSLLFAKIQHERKIKGSYYFRMVNGSYDEQIIREISGMGHEIGYHYETMDTCKGDLDKAYVEFTSHLEKLRLLAPIHTICMHGSPRSAFDNKAIWQKFSYREAGIIGEPYYDIDFNQVAYLTDTGRKWNGSKVSVRDKVQGAFHFDYRSTFDIIKNVRELPDKLMLTFHPQRWTNDPLLWCQEMIMQNIKNQVKKFIVK